MRVKVKRSGFSLSLRHLQTLIKGHILDYNKTYEANAVQNQLYSAFKTNNDIEQKDSTMTSDIVK